MTTPNPEKFHVCKKEGFLLTLENEKGFPFFSPSNSLKIKAVLGTTTTTNDNTNCLASTPQEASPVFLPASTILQASGTTKKLF